ncbi:hypothetical protein BST23_04200 [Mycolicibacterium elephantis]|uniref:Uncharacterized protein n=1 Tax=Mycolicibacterium elephantis TaxID=81858 RepID=A0A1X0D7U9_9MYCO|nr:hypothetical protein [Mycolicibacterium elephantis]ORA68289.1 hypothetical protein BST23_04200 [Mycolicibacterium elephantis]
MSDTTDPADAETPDTAVENQDSAEDTGEENQDEKIDSTDTFSRSYVEKLRNEAAKLRIRAQRADELAHRLHTELVRATGKLADPADLEFDPEHLQDADKLSAAINALLEAKPHLRSRKPIGDVGQGRRGNAEEPVSLLGILKDFA